MIRYGSICSGIEAATVAWHPLGWKAGFFAEIAPFPCAVLKHHYPDVPNYGDFTSIDRSAAGPIDVLVGGTPCQSFSVAGKRAGLDDPRGNLTLEFLALVKRLSPEWVVWENVPGILSIDGGDTFRAFLDTLEELGYVIDTDILDAQYFGVPQRRRRVFVCGQRVENLLQTKTTSSALTIAQCLVESLHLALAVLSGLSTLVSENLGFDGSNVCLSLQKRMELFSLAKEGQAQILLDNLAVLQPLSGCEPGDSESNHGKSLVEDLRSSTATEYLRSAKQPREALKESLSIASLSSGILAESLRVLSKCITSTSGSETTESTIYTCAETLLHITRLIGHSDHSSPIYWNAALSGSTALKEFTSYARQASSSLFTDQEWILPWSNFIREAEDSIFTLGCFGDGEYPDELFPFAESLRGYPAPSREAGQGTSPTLESRAGRSGANNFATSGGLTTGTLQARGKTGGYDPGCDGAAANLLVATSPTLRAGKNSTGGDRPPGTDVDTCDSLVVTHSLRAEGFDASEDGTGRGIPLTIGVIPILEAGARTGRSTDDITAGIGIGEPDDPMFTLQRGKQHAVAFSCKDHGADVGETAPTLRSMGFDKSHANAGGQVAVAFQEAQTGCREYASAGTLRSNGPGHDPVGTRIREGSAVRRLTPEECEALQGFPRGYTKVPYRGKPAADGNRYAAIGNSFAVPVVRWIGERIDMIESRGLAYQESA